ncbi:hypothetical protein [Pelagibius sp. Alg239-R121]|uniref:hypothetical protein n=1 Tax=Pelagibius sp. Alg239-R121 TaxID=2993448 RepID=UPI0024A68B61|nr:hypothetical protein [Pelagibius sp. Alg239-R121]
MARAEVTGRGQDGPTVAATAEFTLEGVIRGLEKQFPVVLAGEGSLAGATGMQSDRLPSTIDGAFLETLGSPGAITTFRFSYEPGSKAESQQTRAWAGRILRNTLPEWRGGKAWVRRRLFELEAVAGVDTYREEKEGYDVVVAREQIAGTSRYRLVFRVSTAAPQSALPLSLSLSQAQLLQGLGEAFPQREEGMGQLSTGPGSHSDRFFSENTFAELQTLGTADDVLAVRYSYQLRTDHQAEVDRNRLYAFSLIENAFPGRPAVAEWLQDAIEVSEQELDSLKEHKTVVREGIGLRVRFFEGYVNISIFPEALKL